MKKNYVIIEGTRYYAPFETGTETACDECGGELEEQEKISVTGTIFLPGKIGVALFLDLHEDCLNSNPSLLRAVQTAISENRVTVNASRLDSVP